MKKYVFVFATLLLFSFVEGLLAQAGWTFKTPMPTARSGICAAVLDGKIYVMGGRNNNGGALDFVERYDPQSNNWESNLPHLKTRRENSAAVSYDGKIFVLGGRSHEDEILKKVEFFDPAQSKWEEFGELREKREALAAVVINGTMYAVGGASNDDLVPKLLNTVEYFDTNEKHWRDEEHWLLSTAAVSLVAVASNDSAYAIGGFNLGPLPFVQRFHLAAGAEIRASLQVARGGGAGAALGDSIFVLGGRGLLQVLNSVEIFLPKEDRWDSFTPLQTARENFAAVVVNGNLFAIGGLDASGNALNSIEAFDLVTAVEEEPPILPLGFQLEQNYPNPFNAGTKIQFRIPPSNGPSEIRLVVYNLKGESVATLFAGSHLPGDYEVRWDGTNFKNQPVASGVYIYTLEMGGRRVAKKMILSR